MEEIARSRAATRKFTLEKHEKPIVDAQEEKQFEDMVRKQTLYETQMELIRHMSNARKVTIQKQPETTQEEFVFTNYLASKIAERRAELTKYDLKEESSDWTDSD